MAIGNPTSPSGDFYEACKNPLYHKIIISCFDHPNIKEGKDIVPGAVTREWIEERRLDWGEDSPLWKAKVLGEFPDEGEDTLIPLSWAEACIGLDLPKEGDKKLGVDVARFGGDMTVFCEMNGRVVLPLESAQKKDTVWTAGVIQRKNTITNYDYIGVDDDGVGGGVTDMINDSGIDNEPFRGGEKAIEDDKFENKRAEAFWILREDIKSKLISLPDDKQLLNL